MKFIEIPVRSSGSHAYIMDKGEFIYERAYPVSVYVVCLNSAIEVTSSAKPTKIIEAGKIIRVQPNTPHKINSINDGSIIFVIFE